MPVIGAADAGVGAQAVRAAKISRGSRERVPMLVRSQTTS